MQYRSLALRVFQVAVAGTAIGVLARAMSSPAAYSSDLQTDYLTARALRDGIDVFTPITDLSARYFPAPTKNFPHPTPHPPLSILLALPLTLVSFPSAVLCWLAFNLVLLVVVGRALGLSPPARLALAAWPPIFCVLLVGQIDIVILALAVLAWHAAEAGRESRAGALLGFAGALKFYPMLFLLPYAARRRYRIVLAGSTIFAVAQLVNLAIIGEARLVDYYTRILPAVTRQYTQLGLNVSPYGALLRLFGGSREVMPLFGPQGAVLPLAVACAVIGVIGLLKLEPEAGPACTFLALPTVWYTYPTVVLAHLRNLLRTEQRIFAVAAGVGVSTVLPLVNEIVNSPLVSSAGWLGGKAPPVAGLVAAAQPIGLLALVALSFTRLSRHIPSDANDVREYAGTVR